MRKIIYNSIIAVFFLGIITTNAQKFEQDYTREISVKKNTNVTLIANYADIEIIEWKKNKIKVDAVLTVNGLVDEVTAKGYLSSWLIGLTHEGDRVKIISKVRSYDFDILDDVDLEMPEISLESLGVLDSVNFSFPEINFNEIYNDSTFNKIFTHDFNFKIDSLSNNFNKNITNQQKYFEEWQKANVDNLVKLREKALEIALKNKELHKERIKIHQKKIEKHQEKAQKHREKRLELLAKINENRNEWHSKSTKKRKEQHLKRLERRKEINEILKNRKETRVRTKLVIYVPKGTNFNMNVNYSKISTN